VDQLGEGILSILQRFANAIFNQSALKVDRRSLSETRDLRVAAQRLFSLLPEMDRPEIAGIVVEAVQEHGLGKAIMNRIRRAAAPRVEPPEHRLGQY